jgi:endonuclease G
MAYDERMQQRIAALGVLTLSGALPVGCGPSVAPAPVAHARAPEAAPSGARLQDSPQVRFGVPVDADPTDDYLMDRGAYVASYNRKRGLANWVAWRLTAADLGSADRSDDFQADQRLPPDFYRVLPGDYKRSGYDRGHLCPSAHRTHDANANSTTFLMTNMMPQVHALNAGPWKGIETYERELVAKAGKEVYVVAGGSFGVNPSMIGHDVEVPVSSYRVTIVVQPGQGPNDVTVNTPVLALEMPNNASAKGRKWDDFRVSVDEVERDTGYDFLSALPDEIEKRLESAIPEREWHADGDASSRLR